MMDKKYFISENDDYAQKMTDVVEPWLRERGSFGYFKGWDGNDMYCEKYKTENAKGSVVVIHGFTECAEKFREMFWYFLHMGYNVFALDHRGHGRSFRYSKNPEAVSIRRFEEYVDDLSCFVENVVIPESGDLPLYIYSHSMGGAVSIQYAQTHPDKFRKIILSAPMVAPRTAGIPYGVAKVLTGFFIGIGKGDDMLVGYSGFNPNRTWENSHDTSKARFDYYQAKRCADRFKQTASPSARWVKEAIGVVGKNLDPERCKAITCPVLLFQPEDDVSVFSDAEDKFISLLPNGTLVKTTDTKHEIFYAVDSAVEDYLEKIEAFLGE